MSGNLKRATIIGAGPAGLTAGYLLQKNGYEVVILEKDSTYVGGLARTVVKDGYRFDIGGHRFFTKSDRVKQFWEEIFSNRLIKRNRLSRILFRGKYFNYPLDLANVIKNVSFFETFKFGISYIWSHLFFKSDVKTFEQWVQKNFGNQLYLAFFKSYTEKVWGRPCSQISSDWAAQRINGLSIFSIIKSLFSKFFGINIRDETKSLISNFDYPRKGPGEMWEECRDQFIKLGGKLILGAEVKSIEQSEQLWKVFFKKNQMTIFNESEICISSMPLPFLIRNLSPSASDDAIIASTELSHRDFITVAVMFEGENTFQDNWIYLHDSNIKAARIQNYRNWSMEMVPNEKSVCLGLEYFCQHNDSFWELSDDKLQRVAKEDLKNLGFIIPESARFEVIKVKEAYPVYCNNYSSKVEILKNEILKRNGLYVVGRNGMHRYNNQDHSIMTSILTVENIVNGTNIYDPWNVNQDAVYIEKN
ncbi:MAG: NAD(P)/FAD-dependent oxidoreductase [Bdellovibrio sp.]